MLSDEDLTRELFDRLEMVWHEVRPDLVPSCAAPAYVRHEAAGNRTVNLASFAFELAQVSIAGGQEMLDRRLSRGRTTRNGAEQVCKPCPARPAQPDRWRRHSQSRLSHGQHTSLQQLNFGA